MWWEGCPGSPPAEDEGWGPQANPPGTLWPLESDILLKPPLPPPPALSDAGLAKGTPTPPPELLGVSGGVGLPGTGLWWKGTANHKVISYQNISTHPLMAITYICLFFLRSLEKPRACLSGWGCLGWGSSHHQHFRCLESCVEGQPDRPWGLHCLLLLGTCQAGGSPGSCLLRDHGSCKVLPLHRGASLHQGILQKSKHQNEEWDKPLHAHY